jgi:beta-barrel assembly-enhancing protease
MHFRQFLSFLTLVSLVVFSVAPTAVEAQTRIQPPKNRYKIEDDVKLGREAANEAEQVFPILDHEPSNEYIRTVGARLVESIPERFQQPAFDYTFKIINASDINAFALPGGPMYLNRGMIEAATNEGEMAGVMAHEIAHVALRHGTARATRQSNIWNQVLGVGAILGGAVLGGDTGAAIGMTLYASLTVLPYSREQERQADLLGAQIMAEAGYDPRDLATMFQTIERSQGGNKVPTWLSTHPNPSKRYENINKESSMLEVSDYPIKETRGFVSTKNHLRGLPPAKTLSEIQEAAKQSQQTGGGGYRNDVPMPSYRTAQVRGGTWMTVSIPDNWRVFQNQNGFEAAPEGAFGNAGITHGTIVGTFRGRSSDLYAATDEYIETVIRSNSYLRRQSGLRRVFLDRRTSYSATLSGTSPVTRAVEIVTINSVQLRNGEIGYVVTVVPARDESRYSQTFRSVLDSVRIF